MLQHLVLGFGVQIRARWKWQALARESGKFLSYASRPRDEHTDGFLTVAATLGAAARWWAKKLPWWPG